ncbi:unnamed protein product, partial [Ascophyllum nodosum]
MAERRVFGFSRVECVASIRQITTTELKGHLSLSTGTSPVEPTTTFCVRDKHRKLGH